MQHLDLTELELATLALGGLNGAMYFFYQPLGILEVLIKVWLKRNLTDHFGYEAILLSTSLFWNIHCSSESWRAIRMPSGDWVNQRLKTFSLISANAWQVHSLHFIGGQHCNCTLPYWHHDLCHPWIYHFIGGIIIFCDVIPPHTTQVPTFYWEWKKTFMIFGVNFGGIQCFGHRFTFTTTHAIQTMWRVTSLVITDILPIFIFFAIVTLRLVKDEVIH